MRTVNVSLPDNLATEVDTIVSEKGYASRSEFFRALLRFYSFLASEKESKDILALTPFAKKPIEEVESALLSSGRYGNDFVKSVVSGLRKSSVYRNED